jgi:hypothetical protein
MRKTVIVALLALVISLKTLLGVMQEVRVFPIVLGVVIKAMYLISMRLSVCSALISTTIV